MGLIFGMIRDDIFICENSKRFTYKKNTYQVVYEGNVYNFNVLKEELLEKGFYFETFFEEEIVLKTFIQYEIDSYDKFLGHFSIIIWNENNKELIFMRDCYAIKSIFYEQLNNGDFLFSNNLSKLMLLNNNTIKYDDFHNLYLERIKNENRIITDTILESAPIMVDGIEIKNECVESRCIFDEVAQIVLNNLDNICIVDLYKEKNQIEVIASYVIDCFNREEVIIKSEFSMKKLRWFLNNVEQPFYNLSEYNLVFALDEIKNVGLVNSNSEEKSFYDIKFWCNKFNINLFFPFCNRKKIIRLEEICNTTDETIMKNNEDKKFVEKEFNKMLKKRENLISEFIRDEIDYHEKIYFIRLSNWIKKYNIRII